MKKLSVFFATLLFIITSCTQSKKDADTPAPTTFVNQGVYPLASTTDLDILLQEIGNARYVLLGEASHGTHEFYTWRAEITKRLIQEKGFTLIAVEGDWPDAYQLNQYIKGQNTQGANARETLKAFNRWPTWMWANEEIAELAEWLRTYNSGQVPTKVGFYGLDVYSLWESMEVVIQYLEATDPQRAATARAAYECFASYKGDEQAYASATLRNPDLCADELAAMLESVRSGMQAIPSAEEAFNLEQNALVAVNAEKYYHTMVRDNAGSWNVRDRHMTETINRLMQLHGPEAKIIVWEHNTHVGDARATDMAAEGMVNVGQLVREQHAGEGVYVVGFGTYQGSVIAGSSWGASPRKMPVPAAQTQSWENIMHQTAPANKIVLTRELKDNAEAMKTRGHRAIGVVYDPAHEQGNYVPTILPDRYDAFMFIDQTEALRPLPVNATGRKNFQPL